MLRDGPVPAFVHGIIEYAAAVLLIAAPFLFSFDSDTALAVSLVAGVALLIVTATTAWPTGLTSSIPVTAHVIIDYLAAGVLIASPFLFGFDDDGTALAFFLIVGVVHLLMTIATRFLPART